MRILLVEDEADLAATLRKTLAESGFSVDVTADGEEAIWRAEGTAYDVIVLDLMIPIVDGWEVLKRIRARGDRSPVLVLTARDATIDKVRALDAGADDYLTKPFAFAELLVRAKALLRRGPIN